MLYLQADSNSLMNKYSKFYLLTSLLLMDCIIYAQPGGDTGGGGLEGGDPPPAPINSQLLLLALLGLVFAFNVYKLRKKELYKKTSN